MPDIHIAELSNSKNQMSQVEEDAYREESNVAHCKSQCNLYHSVIENKSKPQNRCYSKSKTNAYTKPGKGDLK